MKDPYIRFPVGKYSKSQLVYIVYANGQLITEEPVNRKVCDQLKKWCRDKGVAAKAFSVRTPVNSSLHADEKPEGRVGGRR